MVLLLFKTQRRADIDHEEYHKAAARMYELASKMPGFISIKGYTADDGESLSIVKFESEKAMEAWRTHPEHLAVQRRAREVFYESYWAQAFTSAREYEWSRAGGDQGPSRRSA